MERATIIRLGNATSPTVTSSFEDAFGEHSNFFGKKARARRQARRMERINNRKERRKARQEGRLDKKRRRVEARSERREMRSIGRERRKNRRSEGKRRRDQEDLEQERENQSEDEDGGGQSEDERDGGYEPQSRGGYDDEQGGSNDGGYDEEEGGGEDSEDFDGDYDDFDGDYDDFDGDDTDDFDGDYDDFDGDDTDDFDGDYDDFDGDDTDDFDGDYDDFDGDEDTDGFDGEYDDFDGNGEMMDSPTTPMMINPTVEDAAKKIEWNLELASRLNDKAKTSPSPTITDAVCKCNERVAELESSLDGYCSFDGDFMSTADGKLKYLVATKNALPMEERRKRWKERLAAKMKALKERNEMRKKNGLPLVPAPVVKAAAKNPMQAKAMQLRNQYRKRITILKMRMVALRKQYLADATKKKTAAEKLALKQQFVTKRNAIKMRMDAIKKQYLEQVKALKMPIAAPKTQATSSYTGIIGLDDSMDYDANSTEIKLGIEGDGGKTSKIPVKAIVIGLAVGALAMYLLRRYKVI